MAEQKPNEDEKSKAKGWRFLTGNDRALLVTPPQAPPGPGKRAVLPSKKAREDRKKAQDKYNKAKREAKLHFRGALEDLQFLAETMDREWVWDALTQALRADESAPRGVSPAVPPSFTPLELFLHAVVQRIGWDAIPPTVVVLPNPERDTTGWTRPGTPTRTQQVVRRGELYVQRLTTALETGLQATGRDEAHIELRLRSVPDLAQAWRTRDAAPWVPGRARRSRTGPPAQG